MRVMLLSAVAGAGLMLAACDPRVEIKNDGEAQMKAFSGGDLNTIARLECPERENKLTRVSAAADGKSCAYAGEDGTELRLQLVAMGDRTADAVLAPYRTELSALVPVRESDPSSEASADAEALADTKPSGEHTVVRMPGLTIDADDNNAHIRVGGEISIDANDADSTVRINSDDERINIRANDEDNSAVVDIEDDEDGEVRATYIRATDTPGPAGWRAVSYEARGPAAGPVVIAVLKTKAHRHNDAFDAMKDLVRKNVGG